MLVCKKLHEDAILPTVSHPGEDLGYDLYSLEKHVLEPYELKKVHTGIAARFLDDDARFPRLGGQGGEFIERTFGLLFRDRSSMAARGITVSGGVIDAGYTGELIVMLRNNEDYPVTIEAGSKIVQMIPHEVQNYMETKWVDELPKSMREVRGFGSSGY